jgi:ribosomal protein L11 methyltransferase
LTNQPYAQVALPIGEEHFEIAVALLSNIGFESFLEENDTLYAFIIASQWTNEKKSEVEDLAAQLVGRNLSIQSQTIQPQNWNEEWEATLQPIEVSEKLAIVQNEKSYPKKEGQIVIEINPKMSFGTGNHETTRLMLVQLAHWLRPTDTILDVGTGTGVLAIAARKLGNQRVIVACDNDEWSIQNAKENCAANQCDGIETLKLDALNGLENLLSEKTFSLILANINRPVHEKILPVIGKQTPDSSVLISGLLKYDLEWLDEMLKAIQFKLVRLTEEGEWICAFARRAESTRANA